MTVTDTDLNNVVKAASTDINLHVDAKFPPIVPVVTTFKTDLDSAVVAARGFILSKLDVFYSSIDSKLVAMNNVNVNT